MKTYYFYKKRKMPHTHFIFIVALIILVFSSIAFGHGTEQHTDNTFTPIQALKKATELYDRLIGSGKLGGDWETGLERVKIDTRQNNNKNEYVVSFHKKTGDKKTVYFFFTDKGEYAGSNFSGK